MRDDAPAPRGGDMPRYIFATPLWALLVLVTGLALTAWMALGEWRGERDRVQALQRSLADAAPARLREPLAGAALVLILLTSVPLGIWAARHRDRLPDFIVRIIAFLGVSMPNFWLAFLLVMLFSVYLQWLPAMGYGGWQHIILPAVSIAFMSLAINARLLRASMLEVSGQRHVVWARLRGLSTRIEMLSARPEMYGKGCAGSTARGINTG